MKKDGGSYSSTPSGAKSRSHRNCTEKFKFLTHAFKLNVWVSKDLPVFFHLLGKVTIKDDTYRLDDRTQEDLKR